MRLSQIVLLGCEVLGVTPGQLTGRGRSHREARNRWAVMVACRHYSRNSLPQIADALGRDNHTTIIHGLRRAQQCCAEDRRYFRKVAGLCGAIESEILHATKARQTRETPQLVFEQRVVALLPGPQRPRVAIEPCPPRCIMVPA